MSKKLLITLSALVTLAPGVYASNDDTPNWVMDTSGIGKASGGIVRSDQLLELGVPNASAMQLEGENLLRMGNLDQALTALQRSVEMAPLDMDKRVLYSEALEKKLMTAKEKDPKLFNFVVKQWLYIFRKAEFIDQTMQARQHLVHLTGTAPKQWEKSAKFLGRVLVPEDGSAKLALTKKTAAN